MVRKSARSLWLKMPLTAGWIVLVISSLWLIVTGVVIMRGLRFFMTSASATDAVAIFGNVVIVGVGIVMAVVSIVGMLLGCLLIFTGNRMRVKQPRRKQVKASVKTRKS